jgi:hypothetical protein
MPTLLILQILILVIFGVLAFSVYHVLQEVVAAAKLFSKHSTDVFQLQTTSFAAQSEALHTFVELQHESLKRLVAIHADTLACVADTHGQAAVRLKGATDSHNIAASAIVDASLLLKQASDSLGALLSNSALFEIKSHTEALRRFWVK